MNQDANRVKSLLDEVASKQDDAKLREIEALRLAGVSTWDDERQAFEIRRRKALRGIGGGRP